MNNFFFNLLWFFAKNWCSKLPQSLTFINDYQYASCLYAIILKVILIKFDASMIYAPVGFSLMPNVMEVRSRLRLHTI